MQGGFQHFHYIIGSYLTLFASNHTGTRLIHHRKPSGHQLPAALSLFARCWLNLAILLSVLKAFTAILYCTEIQYLLKCGRRSILFATATASMRAKPAPYFSTLDLNSSVRDSGALDEVWGPGPQGPSGLVPRGTQGAPKGVGGPVKWSTRRVGRIRLVRWLDGCIDALVAKMHGNLLV